MKTGHYSVLSVVTVLFFGLSLVDCRNQDSDNLMLLSGSGSDPLQSVFAGDAPGDTRNLTTGSSRMLSTGEINSVAYETLSCAGVITFDDVAGGSTPGTNYDVIFESDGADFAERFAGQTRTYAGDFDILSGTPTNPLTLQAGLTGANLNVFTHTSSQVLTGLGPRLFPSLEAIGEGSFAVLFDHDQSEFGFILEGGNNGSAVVEFFRRDGTLIDTVTIPDIGWARITHGFQRTGGQNDIAGISVYNTDPGGIGFDDLCHDIPGEPGPANEAPIANAGADQSILSCAADEQVTVQLDGSASSDPDGDPLEYFWSAPGVVFSDPTAVNPSGSFPAGTTTVTLTVTDPDGLSHSDTVDVTIETDTTAPALSLSADPSTLWPPNHIYHRINLISNTQDQCPVGVTASVQSNEQDNGIGNGDGNTTGDIRVTRPDNTTIMSSNSQPQVSFNLPDDILELRAERNGTGDGRIYTIVVTAVDSAGNTSSQSITVSVVHDQGEN